MQLKNKAAWSRGKSVDLKRGVDEKKRQDGGYEDGDEGEHCQVGGMPWKQQENASGIASYEGKTMALARKGTKLGYACFDEDKSTIWVDEILVSTDIRETVQALKLHLGPTSFLIDAHLLADEGFCKLLGSSVSEDRPQFHVRVAKARDWDTRRAVSQLCHCLDVRQLAKGPHSRNRENAMYLKNERLATSSEAVSSLFFMDDKGSRQGRDEGLDPRRNYDRLSCVIDFMSESLLVKALGALLVHLQCTTFQLEIGGRVTVQTLERFDLGSFVHLDSNALTSLQIFHEEKHPNVISGRGKAKEGFSLFALLDQTHSLPGRKCLKEWMLRPLRSVRGIRERQNMVELLLHPEAMEVVTNAGMLLGKVGDVQRILTRMRRAGSTVNDWLTLANTAEHVLLLQSCLAVLVHLTARLSSASDKGPTTAGEEEHRTNEGPYSSAMAMLQGFLDRISRQAVGRVSEALTKVLDLEVTRESKTVAVRMGCDEELDRLRGDYDGLEEFLSEEARGVLAEQSSQLLSKISVQFLPQVGFLVIVQANERIAVENDPRFRFLFAEGDALYYKTPRMDVLDDSIGDLSAAIQDLEGLLLRQLAEEILKEEIALTEAVRACAELDVLMAFAQLAGGLAWVRPMVTEERVVVVKDGRHPLQELTVETFIPNDVFLMGGDGNAVHRDGDDEKHAQKQGLEHCNQHGTRGVAVVTGPNFSGKSVYIKMVGMLVYLAHLGCFLPCQQALIGVVDSIRTRIASAETVTVQQSSFTIDCSQMNAVFQNASPSSLVLVDEFGKGSAETDGLALLVACLSRLQRLGARALVTTHFLELFQRKGLLSPQLANDISYRMDIFVPPLPPPTSPSISYSPATAASTPSAANIHTIVPLFKLTKGVASSSDGFSCAALAGLAPSLIRRAEQIAKYHVEGSMKLEPLARPIAFCGGSENEKEEKNQGREVLRFNLQAQEALELFLGVEDWLLEKDQDLQGFIELLQQV